MNPFEWGMVAANGLHSVMSRRLMAKREVRTVQGVIIVSSITRCGVILGDARSDTAGSYFRNSAEQVNYFSTFGTCLIRSC